MKKILIIPHHPANIGIKIRLAEIARNTADSAEVFMVCWHAAQGGYNLSNRIMACVKDALALPRLRRDKNITIVEFPILHQPIALARKWNAAWLEYMLNRIEPDAVINGSYYLFPVKNKRNFKYIVDLADLPPQEKKLRAWIHQEAISADAVTAVSLSLAEYIGKKYALPVTAIANGFSPADFLAVTLDDIVQVRRQYDLETAFIVGYAGYIGDWINVDLAVAAVKEFKKIQPNAIAVFVGNAPDLSRLKERYKNEPVVFIGPVSCGIEKYICAFDLGILPSKRSLFQDMAFHLKLIEYTAAKKAVISTPLEEAMRLNFSNIVFAQETVSTWVDALIQASKMKTQESWIQSAKAYDWRNIAQKFLELVL